MSLLLLYWLVNSNVRRTNVLEDLWVRHAIFYCVTSPKNVSSRPRFFSWPYSPAGTRYPGYNNKCTSTKGWIKHLHAQEVALRAPLPQQTLVKQLKYPLIWQLGGAPVEDSDNKDHIFLRRVNHQLNDSLSRRQAFDKGRNWRTKSKTVREREDRTATSTLTCVSRAWCWKGRTSKVR